MTTIDGKGNTISEFKDGAEAIRVTYRDKDMWPNSGPTITITRDGRMGPAIPADRAIDLLRAIVEVIPL